MVVEERTLSRVSGKFKSVDGETRWADIGTRKTDLCLQVKQTCSNRFSLDFIISYVASYFSLDHDLIERGVFFRRVKSA